MKTKPKPKSIKGLRFVRTKDGEWIDQYGRIFTSDKNGNPDKPTGRCGYATH